MRSITSSAVSAQNDRDTEERGNGRFFRLTHPLSGFFAPTRFEADVHDCIVTGQIPADLEGAFYRLHGDWIYAPRFADEASLSADGLHERVPLPRGSVDYRGAM